MEPTEGGAEAKPVKSPVSKSSMENIFRRELLNLIFFYSSLIINKSLKMVLETQGLNLSAAVEIINLKFSKRPNSHKCPVVSLGSVCPVPGMLRVSE